MEINPIAVVQEIDDNVSRAPDFERIKAARKRRSIQLKKWYQYDKLKDKEEQVKYKKGYPSLRRVAKIVRFNQNLILLEASNREDIDEVRRLLSEGVCPDVTNDDGLTALHQCAINNSIDLCQVLVQHKANVNAKDKELWTPLHAAAICGFREICGLLIKSGADLMSLNADGNMPYDICEDNMCLDLLESAMSEQGITQQMIDGARAIPEQRMLADLRSILAKHGVATAQATFSALDPRQGANHLHIACTQGYLDVVRFLLAHPLRIRTDISDRDGWHPIHCAAFYGNFDVVQYLVTQGANLDALTETSGETVYEMVYDNNMYDQLLLLKREMERRKSAVALQQNNNVGGSVSRTGGLTNGGGTMNGSNGAGGGGLYSSMLSTNSGTEVGSSFGLVRRRSSNNPKSASIRRSSMKEKSNLSWKEARQEAEIRLSLERKDNPLNASQPHPQAQNGSATTNPASNKTTPSKQQTAGGGNKDADSDASSTASSTASSSTSRTSTDYHRASLHHHKPPHHNPLHHNLPHDISQIQLQMSKPPSSRAPSTSSQQQQNQSNPPKTRPRKSPIPTPRQPHHTRSLSQESLSNQQQRNPSTVSNSSVHSLRKTPIGANHNSLPHQQQKSLRNNTGNSYHKPQKMTRPDSCCITM